MLMSEGDVKVFHLIHNLVEKHPDLNPFYWCLKFLSKQLMDNLWGFYLNCFIIRAFPLKECNECRNCLVGVMSSRPGPLLEARNWLNGEQCGMLSI